MEAPELDPSHAAAPVRRRLIAPAVLAAACAALTAALVAFRCGARQGGSDELLAQIQPLRERAGRPRAASPDLAACFHARLGHAEWLTEDLPPGPKQKEVLKIRRLLEDIREDLDSRDRGEDFLSAKTEPFLCGYWSEIDGTVQPFGVALPGDFDRSRRWPLLVLLHGQGLFKPYQCRARPERGMIVVAPQGRGGMDYKFVGETDVLRAVDEASRLFPVDPDRVYLAGNSMGGTGAWHVATRFPDRFAAIMPVSGSTDVRVWAELWNWTTPADSPQRDVRDFLRDDTGALAYAANLLNVAVVAVHGEEDPIVDRMHSERMVAALKRNAHPSVTLNLLPLVEHGVRVSESKGLAGLRRTERPARVRYRTAWLRYDGAYWVRIRGIGKRLRFAEVDAAADPESGSITVRTGNVTALELLADRTPLDGPPRALTIDGCRVDLAAGSPLRFTRDEAGGWRQSARVATDGEAFPPPKSGEVEGPVEHAFMSSFVVVGPSEDSPRAAAAREAAEAFASMWRMRFGSPPRTRRDLDVTEADIADHGLVLFGGPGENTLAARVIGALPVSIGSDGVTLGGRTYSGPGAGVKLCYPNPLNPRRYVVLVAGVAPESYADVNVRFGNWFDWIPYDCRSHFDYAVFDDLTVGRSPETFLAWGFFGERWELDDALRFDGDAGWRSRVRPRARPAEAPRAAGAGPIWLDALAADSQKLGKEYLERNRLFDGTSLMVAGREYRRGLAFRWPGSVTFANPGRARLRATVGIAWDGRTQPCGDRRDFERAVFVVADERGEDIFRSKPRRWSDPPLELDVDVSGRSGVTLSATGGRVWLNTTCVWADARLEE